MKKINCKKCPAMHHCCKTGAWLDLEEAKKILELRLKGEFFQLEKDPDFPSGYRIGTSYEEQPCTFLDKDGLCSVHKVDYSLKPRSCIEFPYEGGQLSEFAKDLCLMYEMPSKKRRCVKKRRAKKQ